MRQSGEIGRRGTVRRDGVNQGGPAKTLSIRIRQFVFVPADPQLRGDVERTWPKPRKSELELGKGKKKGTKGENEKAELAFAREPTETAVI